MVALTGSPPDRRKYKLTVMTVKSILAFKVREIADSWQSASLNKPRYSFNALSIMTMVIAIIISCWLLILKFTGSAISSCHPQPTLALAGCRHAGSEQSMNGILLPL